MATTLADAFVYFRGDDTKLKGDLDKAEHQTRSAMGNIGNLAKGIALGVAGAAVGALGAITGIAISGIGAASDLGESLSKVKVVFGENADAIEEWSKTAATALGQSQQQALEAAGTFGNLFDALGIGEQNAKDMSIGLVELASDLASFNNLDPTEALDKLRAGIVGETEPLRALGVNLNAAAVEMRALEMSGKAAKEELTESEKVAARYTLILEQTTNAQGDFERTSGGLANQQRILNGHWTDLKATLGSALLPAITSVITAFNGFMTELGPKLKTFLETTLPGFLATLRAGWDADWGNMRTTLTTFANEMPGLVQDMWTEIKRIFTDEGEVTQTEWEEFWDNVAEKSTGTMRLILVNLTEGFRAINAALDLFMSLFQSDWDPFWEARKNFLTAIFEGILNYIEFGFGPEFRNAIADALNKVSETLSNWAKNVANFFDSMRVIFGLGGSTTPTGAFTFIPPLPIVPTGNTNNNNSQINIHVNGGGGDPYYTGREVGNGFLDAMRQAGG